MRTLNIRHIDVEIIFSLEGLLSKDFLQEYFWVCLRVITRSVPSFSDFFFFNLLRFRLPVGTFRARSFNWSFNDIHNPVASSCKCFQFYYLKVTLILIPRTSKRPFYSLCFNNIQFYIFVTGEWLSVGDTLIWPVTQFYFYF